MAYTPLRERLPGQFAEPKYTEHEVRGQSLHFYSLSPSLLFELKGISAPILAAMGTLFADRQGDKGNHYESLTNPTVLPVSVPDAEPDDEGNVPVRTVKFDNVRITNDTEALNVEMARLRDQQLRSAIEDLIVHGMSSEMKRLVGRIICDSLREEFPECRGGHNNGKKQRDDTALAFMDDPDLDIEATVEFLLGVAAANKNLFAPFQSMIAKAQKTGAGGQVLKALIPKTEKDSSNDTDSAEPIDTVDGETATPSE